MAQINEKEQLFCSLLKHPKIEEIRGRGLMLAPILSNDIDVAKVVHRCSEKGIIFFLLWKNAPMNFSSHHQQKEIEKGCGIILDVLNNRH